MRRVLPLLFALAGCDDLFNLDPVPVQDAVLAGSDAAQPGDVSSSCTPSSTTYQGSGIVAIAAGDYDADGATDLAVAENTGSAGDVALLGGMTDRTLPVRKDITPGPQPVSVTWFLPLATVYPHLVVIVHPDDHVRVYPNNNGAVGDVMVQTPITAPSTAVVAADVYAASPPELVVGATASVQLFSVTSTTVMNIGTYPLANSVAFSQGNLGGDSAQDLAVASSGSNYSSLIGTRSNSFASQTIQTPGPTKSVAVADFTGDQADDIAMSIPTANEIDIATAPSFTFASPIPLMAPGPLLAIEMTGDSHLDLVAGVADGVVLLPGHGDGTFDTPQRIAQTTSPVIALAAGDFDHDGNRDIAYTTATAVTVQYECP